MGGRQGGWGVGRGEFTAWLYPGLGADLGSCTREGYHENVMKWGAICDSQWGANQGSVESWQGIVLVPRETGASSPMILSMILPRFRIEHHGGMRFIHIPLGFGVWKLVIMVCLSQKF